MMTVKEFANLNSKMAEAFEQYSRTMEVYNFLCEHKGQKFTPTEIAKELGFVYHFTAYAMDWVNYYKVVNPLYWLLEREEIKREEIKTKITIEVEGHYEYKTMRVDGIKYQSEYPLWVDGGTKEVEKTSYKWYVE